MHYGQERYKQIKSGSCGTETYSKGGGRTSKTRPCNRIEMVYSQILADFVKWLTDILGDRGVLYFSKEHDYTVKYWHIADDKTSSATHILMDYKRKVV